MRPSAACQSNAFAWGLSVAYRVSFSTQAASPRARGGDRFRRILFAAACGLRRGPVRFPVRRIQAAAAARAAAAVELLQRSVRLQCATCPAGAPGGGKLGSRLLRTKLRRPLFPADAG